MSLIGAIRHVGQGTAAIVADVWAAATRTLTAFTGQPRTDLVGSDAAIWSHATRTLTAFAAQDLFIYPAKQSVYGSIVSPQSSATPNALGTWVLSVANVGVGKVLLGIFLMAGGNYDMQTEIQVGEGAVGFEAAVDYILIPGQTGLITIFIPLWRALTDNAALSFAVKDGDATQRTWRITPYIVG